MMLDLLGPCGADTSYLIGKTHFIIHFYYCYFTTLYLCAFLGFQWLDFHYKHILFYISWMSQVWGSSWDKTYTMWFSNHKEPFSYQMRPQLVPILVFNCKSTWWKVHLSFLYKMKACRHLKLKEALKNFPVTLKQVTIKTIQPQLIPILYNWL